MREIKFRAWDGHNKVMKVYSLKQLADEDKFSSDTEFEAIQSGFDKWQWMQFTGLKDKNGKDIFEGDILQASHFPKQLIAGFCKESAAFGACTDQSMEIEKMYWFANDIVLDQDDWYVIGNIYENPDLITATQGNG